MVSQFKIKSQLSHATQSLVLQKVVFSFLIDQHLKYIMLCALLICIIFQTHTKKHVWLIPGWPRIMFLYPYTLSFILDNLKIFSLILFKADHLKNVEKLKILRCFSLIFLSILETVVVWGTCLNDFHVSKEILLANSLIYLNVYYLWMYYIYHQNDFPLTQLSYV